MSNSTINAITKNNLKRYYLKNPILLYGDMNFPEIVTDYSVDDNNTKYWEKIEADKAEREEAINTKGREWADGTTELQKSEEYDVWLSTRTPDDRIVGTWMKPLVDKYDWERTIYVAKVVPGVMLVAGMMILIIQTLLDPLRDDNIIQMIFLGGFTLILLRGAYELFPFLAKQRISYNTEGLKGTLITLGFLYAFIFFGIDLLIPTV